MPIEQWWYDAVESLVGRGDRLYTGKQLADRIGVDEERVSNLRRKINAPLRLVEQVSDALEIPRPFISFPTRELAHEYRLKALRQRPGPKPRE